jgi:hypothetical protein
VSLCVFRAPLHRDDTLKIAGAAELYYLNTNILAVSTEAAAVGRVCRKKLMVINSQLTDSGEENFEVLGLKDAEASDFKKVHG